MLALGELMDHVPILLVTTRTEDAGTTRLPRMLLTGVLVAHTATTTSSAPPVDAPSLWTVLVTGELMDLATTTQETTRTTVAGTTSTARVLLTMVMAVHMLTTTSSVRTAVVLSLLTVLEVGAHMHLVSMMKRTTKWRDAEYILSLPLLRTMDMAVPMPMD